MKNLKLTWIFVDLILSKFYKIFVKKTKLIIVLFLFSFERIDILWDKMSNLYNQPIKSVLTNPYTLKVITDAIFVKTEVEIAYRTQYIIIIGCKQHVRWLTNQQNIVYLESYQLNY